jgi:hypothetical protein
MAVGIAPPTGCYIRGAVGPPHLSIALARANLPRLRPPPHAHLAHPTGRSCTRRLSCAPCPPHICARAQVRCISSPALASTSASSTAAPPKWPFYTRRFSVQLCPPRSRACLGSSDRTSSAPRSPRDWPSPPQHTHRARLAGVHVARVHHGLAHIPISVHLPHCYFCSSSPPHPSIPLCSLDVHMPFFLPASLASTRTAIPIRAR